MIGGDDVDFTHEEFKIMQEAIDHYGEENQLDMAIEEMAELTKAICKCKRLENAYPNITSDLLACSGVLARNADFEKAVEVLKGNVAEEIADVYVMLEQLTMIFDCEERVSAIASEKIRRLKGRMDND